MIRPFDRRDGRAVSALLRALVPEWVMTERGLLDWIESTPERARLRTWVAEDGREVVAFGEAGLRWESSDEGVADFWVGVLPLARRRGTGGALYALTERHLAAEGARTLQTFVRGDEDGERFLAAHGFRKTRREQCWLLDPRTTDPRAMSELAAAKAAEGFRVVPLRELRDHPEELYPVYREAHGDIPSDHREDNMSFEEWRRAVFDYADLDFDASHLVLAGRKPASFALVAVDREGRRATHMMTGTARDFRHRGLARLAKLATIRWAAENGVTALVTENDTTNADMLALNEHLGYRPTSTFQYFARDL